ncbi:MAG: GerMN domain-containing protein [Lachnospiraceae bacterium]|nr:GerMN domain-containing protein [Lachnospiraceae bacterium]
MKNKILSFLLVLCILTMVLAGCGKNKTGQDIITPDSYRIYCINNGITKVAYEVKEVKADSVTDYIDLLFKELKADPSDVTLRKAIPDEVTIRDYSLENGELTVNFESNYQLITGIEEILRRTAIVKTLTQIDGVDYVAFTAGGQPLMDSAGLPIGFMESGDFIDNTGGETNYLQTVTITLYFANEEGNGLVTSRHQVEFDGTISLENLVVRQLIAGPLPEETGMQSAMPHGTIINKVTKKDGICYLDLNGMFLEDLPGVTDEVVIYSIVNSLAEISGISKVQFMVNGEVQKKYRENIPFDGLFERNLDLVN